MATGERWDSPEGSPDAHFGRKRSPRSPSWAAVVQSPAQDFYVPLSPVRAYSPPLSSPPQGAANLSNSPEAAAPEAAAPEAAAVDAITTVNVVGSPAPGTPNPPQPVRLPGSPAEAISRDQKLHRLLERLEDFLDGEVDGEDGDRVCIHAALETLIYTVNAEWGGLELVSILNRSRIAAVKRQVNLFSKAMVQPRVMSAAALAAKAAKAEAKAEALADKAAALAEDQEALAIALARVATDRLAALELKIKMGERMSAASKRAAALQAELDAIKGSKPESPPKHLQTLPEPVPSRVALHRSSVRMSAIHMERMRGQRSARLALVATARALVHTNNCAVCEMQRKVDEQLKSGAPPTQALQAMQNKLILLEHAKQQSGFALDRQKRFLESIEEQM